MRVRSIGIMTLLNVAGAAVGVGQSVVIAYYFGASRAIEIFFAAAAVEASILHLTQTGQLTEIFLPTYHRIKHERGTEAGQKCFAVILNILLASIACVAGLMFFLAPVLVRLRVPGFTDQELQQTTHVFQAMLPLLALHVTAAMLTMLANAEKWFGVPEAISVATRILGVVVVIAAASTWGIWAMVAGMYVSNFLVVVVLGLLAARLGYRHRFRFRQEGFQAAALLRQLGATFLYVTATQIFAFAFDAGLSRLPQGVFAVFKYVQQHLLAKTFGLLLRPINVVFFTHFSEALAQGAARLVSLAKRALNLSLAAYVLTIVGFVAGGEPLLKGLWGGASFSSEDVSLAARFACFMYLLLIVTAAGQVYRRMAVSLGMARGFYIGRSLVQIACALLCLWLLPTYEEFGAFVVLAVNMVGLAVVPIVLVLSTRWDLMAYYSPVEVARWLLAAVLGIAAAAGLARVGVFDLDAPARLAQLAIATACGGTAIAMTLAAAWCLGVAEIRQGVARMRLTIGHALGARHG